MQYPAYIGFGRRHRMLCVADSCITIYKRCRIRGSMCMSGVVVSFAKDSVVGM